MKTFVVRLFVSVDPENPADALHGVVEDLAGGLRRTFAGGEELLALLTGPAPESDRDRRESAVN